MPTTASVTDPTRMLHADVMRRRARTQLEVVLVLEWVLGVLAAAATSHSEPGGGIPDRLLLALVLGGLAALVPIGLGRLPWAAAHAHHAVGVGLGSFAVLLQVVSAGEVLLVRHALLAIFLASLFNDPRVIATTSLAVVLWHGVHSLASAEPLDPSALAWILAAMVVLMAKSARVRRQLDALITERAQLEREREHLEGQRAHDYERALRARVDEAERAQHEGEVAGRAQLLASLSHELRTPLNAVVGFLELLSRSRLSPQQAANVEGAHTSARHVLALVSDVLDAAKIESGALELEREPFDVAKTVRDACRLVEGSARDRGVALEVELSDDLGAPLLGDSLRVRQIVINLVSNAVKFARSKVTVRGSWVGETDALHIDVLDDGPGIPPDRLARIFEPYRQADRATARRHGGTGLGLSISRRLARLMRGDVIVRSAGPTGSEFRFVAPLRRAEPSAIRQDRVADDPAPELPSLRILVADDDASNRFVSTQLLSLVGHRVTAAVDGQDALDLALANPYDLLILDVEMPRLDGTEVARRLRATGATLPILGFTGHASQQQRLACLRSGMDGVVEKPADLARLSQGIAEVMATHLRPQNGLEIAKSLAAQVGVPTPPAGLGRSAVLEELAQRAVSAAGDPATHAGDPTAPAKAAANGPALRASASVTVMREVGAGVDLDELLLRVGGDRALAHDVLVAVRDESRRLFADLADAATRGDLESMRRVAHTLKGCVANVGARPVREAVTAVEVAAKAGELERARELATSALLLSESLAAALTHACEARAA